MVSAVTKKKCQFIVLFSLTVILAAGVWFFYSVRHLPKYNYNIDQWKSEQTEYRNNGYSVNEVVKDTGKKIDWMWGPYLPLKKGSYTALIKYSAEQDQSCIATAAGGYAEVFQSSVGLLSRHLNEQIYQFEVTDDVPEFQLVFGYHGQGDFTVHSVSIMPNSNRQKRVLTEIIAAVLLLDGCILLGICSEEKKRTIFSLVGITVLISLPMWIYGINNGYDLGVHYLRIEAIVQALRSGQFPARISSITLYGLGYPFSIYYNDLFLYFPALLRLLGFSVTSAYKIYLLSVNLLTVLIGYYSFGKIFKKRNLALILTLIYSTASYRLVNVYVRSAVGEYTAQAFLPLLALAMFRIYFDTESSFRKGLRNSLLLAAAMSGIIGSHMLTTIMVCFVMLLFALIFIKRTIRKQTVLTLTAGVIFSVLLNMYFLVPFVDYYINVPANINRTVENELMMIQSEGVYPAQFFAFFQSVSGGDSKNVPERMQLTPGPLLMLLFVCGIIKKLMDIENEKSKWNKYDILYLFSFFLLFLSSNFFPWNWLERHFLPWRILVQIQYPCRFLVLAILFLTLLAGYVIRDFYKPYIFSAIAFCAVLAALWFMGSLFDDSSIINVLDTSGVDPSWTCCEQYMLQGSSKENIDSNPSGINMENIEILSRNANTLEVTCRSANQFRPHIVEAPLYSYKGYHVVDENGIEYEIFSGNENRISFELPDNFDSKVTVRFSDPGYWRLALWLSVFAGATSAIWLIFDRKRNGRKGDTYEKNN